jgi:Mlc titration factor MtfA (ptsG expression regulator)
LNRIRNSLLAYWRKVEQQRIEQEQSQLRQQLENIRLQNEKRENEVKIAIGILAGLLVLGLSSK